MSMLLPCGLPWEGTGGAGEMFGLYRLAFVSGTRAIVWVSFSTYVDPSCASKNLLRSFSAENCTATNLTQPGPLPDRLRSTALCTPTGLYEWIVTLPGSSASLGWFVKVFNEVIKGWKQVAARYHFRPRPRRANGSSSRTAYAFSW